MRTKLLWDKIFPLRIGDRVKLKNTVKFLPAYMGRKGTVLSILGNVFVQVRLDHPPRGDIRVYENLFLHPEDLEKIS